MPVLWATGAVDGMLGTAGSIETDMQHVQHVRYAVPCTECLNSKRHTHTDDIESFDRQKQQMLVQRSGTELKLRTYVYFVRP